MDQSKTVTANSAIQVHYIIKLKDGSTADTTRHTADSDPVLFVLGDGQLSDKLEAALVGMHVGEKKKIPLLAKDAFGEIDPTKIVRVPLTSFDNKDLELEVGSIIEFDDEQGNLAPGIIRHIGNKDVTVDFNHPLCGQEIMFHVEIIAMENNNET